VLPERFTIAADIAVAVPNVSKMPPVVRAFMAELGAGGQKTGAN
jgi:hypothetical protein